MFVDTSVVIAILSHEPDESRWAEQLERVSAKITSPLVVLEAAMRLSTKMAIDPVEVEGAIADMLREADIEIVAIDENDSKVAVQAFAEYGKGRGHPAQLNLSDCLSYACAKNRGLPLLYKGSDFAKTDLA